MLKKANGRVDGLVIETRTAGGHNAPPRGKLQLSDAGEPIYGERDAIDIAKLRELGVPFWLAGGYGHPEKVREALAQGAAGVQVGTAFEFAWESGLDEELKHALMMKIIDGKASVFTDPLASPTGFPFKVARLEGTNSEPAMYAERHHASATWAFCASRTGLRKAESAIAAPPSRSACTLRRAARSRTPLAGSACATVCWRTSGMRRFETASGSSAR